MGKLYVVPTPVGNMEDMTFRAIRILKEADLILAEDTRTSGILLKHYEIKNAMQSHHKFNEHATVGLVADNIAQGRSAALHQRRDESRSPGQRFHFDPRFKTGPHQQESRVGDSRRARIRNQSR